MIIGRAKSPSGEWLLLGLSRVNVKRLMEGQPIRLTRNTHGDGVPEGWSIAILFGETELELAKSLREARLIGPETKINVDPRLGS